MTYTSSSSASAALVGCHEAVITHVSTEVLKNKGGVVLCVTYRLSDDAATKTRRLFCDRMNVWHGSVYACEANLLLLERFFNATEYALPDLSTPDAERFLVLVGKSFRIQICSSVPKDGEPMFYVETWSAMGDTTAHRTDTDNLRTKTTSSDDDFS